MRRATFNFVNKMMHEALIKFTADELADGLTTGRIQPYDAALVAALTLKDLVDAGVITIVIHKDKKED